MKVSELIAKLQVMPQDMLVCVSNEKMYDFTDDIGAVVKIDSDGVDPDSVVICVNMENTP